jgi:hypothetical protein
VATIHLIYPHGRSISTPDAIGRNLALRLRHRHEVIQYDWDESTVIKPGHGDILIGHPHPAPWTVFRRSLRNAGWGRTIAMFPYTHGDIRQVAWANRIVCNCDLLLAITGNYWYQTVASSVFAHWQPLMVHLDLAVAREDFPVIKQRFNPRGKRRFLYIGHDYWFKNLDYLVEIGREHGGAGISWMGWSKRKIDGLQALGRQDFGTSMARRLVSEHDFMITVGFADPNPTTILEAMAWGLVPVCTRESGYAEYPGIVNVPLNNARAAADVLQMLQEVDESELERMQGMNWAALDAHFNWDRFGRQVLEAVESSEERHVARIGTRRQMNILWAALTSPHFWLRPLQLWRSLRALYHHRLERTSSKH